MERNLLVGNGINIQFGGIDVYSGSAIMKRVVENIEAEKYAILTENVLSIDEQKGILDGLVKVINQIKNGGYKKHADGLFMQMELERIARTYPDESTVESVFLEDYFLAAEVFNNSFRGEDGEEKSEEYRRIFFSFLRQIIVDGIYNDGEINSVYKAFPEGLKKYFGRFDNIFTTNYDYNIERFTGIDVCHLHGEFDRLAPEYDVSGQYYKENQDGCDKLINGMVPGLKHIYSDSIMSWSWLDKYGEIMDRKVKEEKFKSIGGQLEILGLSPANDEHLFLMINNNPNIKSVVYYYLSGSDMTELPHHLRKPITYKKVLKLWDSMEK